MTKGSKKELIKIFLLTILFGFGAYYLASAVDEKVAEVRDLRAKVDELTRISVKRDDQDEEIRRVDEYKSFYDEILPETVDVIDILEQMEIMSDVAGTDITVKLEEAVISEDSIEFKDTKSKTEFLKKLEVKEYSPAYSDQSSTDSTQTNVALQMVQGQGTPPDEEEVEFQYLEVNMILKGSYDQIRKYISLLQNSKYIFNIEELRMNKTEKGMLEAPVKVRAFIFEK